MDNQEKKKVGILGYGNMGQAIAERIKNSYAVYVFDKDADKISGLKDIFVVNDALSLVKQTEIIILAVKPQDFPELLDKIKDFSAQKVFITIAAGITTQYLKSELGIKARVVRVMPNMPAQIGRGVSVISKGSLATDADADLAWQLAHNIFSNLGGVLMVENEKMINAATAVSGSGPAFFCYYIKDKKNARAKKEEFIMRLADAAVNLGFDKSQAQFLAEKTVDGIIAMLNEKNLSCAEVIKMVSSKGGTTQAGLEVLGAGGSLDEAVRSAYERAEELGKRS